MDLERSQWISVWIRKNRVWISNEYEWIRKLNQWISVWIRKIDVWIKVTILV